MFNDSFFVNSHLESRLPEVKLRPIMSPFSRVVMSSLFH